MTQIFKLTLSITQKKNAGVVIITDAIAIKIGNNFAVGVVLLITAGMHRINFIG